MLITVNENRKLNKIIIKKIKILVFNDIISIRQLQNQSYF